MKSSLKFSHMVLVVVLSALTAFAVGKYMGPAEPSQTKPQETAFERIMRTGTIKCGYVVIPPQLARDPNTGEISGIGADLTHEIAKRLNLKVEWTEEVSFATMTEGFKAGRYDVYCQPGYRWVPATRSMEYSVPVFYTTTNAYVRADDTRFDADLKAINDPAIKVSIIDGEAAQRLREEDFPLSGISSMPQNTDISFLFEAVASKKADVVFANPLMIMPYLLSNPNVLRRVTGHPSIRVHSHAFGFGKGEHDLVSMFNVTLEEMNNSGATAKILNKYEDIPDSFVRVKRVAP